ncbi:MAG: hypothetical protein Q8N99_00380 [Nanoarchaeota archaeon]|nr:hypothetical protein [Nanoarchaeota archaeon]
MKKMIFIIVFVLVLALIGNILAQNNVNSCPMGGAAYSLNGSYGSGTMILSWTFSILLIILIIAGIYWFIKSANHKNNRR